MIPHLTTHGLSRGRESPQMHDLIGRMGKRMRPEIFDARDRDLRWRCPESNSDLDLMRYELILIENE